MTYDVWELLPWQRLCTHPHVDHQVPEKTFLVAWIIKTARKSSSSSTLQSAAIVVWNCRSPTPFLDVTQTLTLSSSRIWRSDSGMLSRCEWSHWDTAVRWSFFFCSSSSLSFWTWCGISVFKRLQMLRANLASEPVVGSSLVLQQTNCSRFRSKQQHSFLAIPVHFLCL